MSQAPRNTRTLKPCIKAGTVPAPAATGGEQPVLARNLAQMSEMLGLVAAANGPRSDAEVRPISEARLDQASWAFTTRRVPHEQARTLVRSGNAPEAGDLVLARVDVIGHHAGLQLVHGRRRQMFPGDEIVVAYGNRYACNQFEAVIPDTLGPCHLVAGGGIASRATCWHDRIVRGPTHITPIGLLGDANGQVLNLRDFALAPRSELPAEAPPVFAVLGTAMDAGKTQTAAYLVRGLRAAGMKPGYAKVTGTGAGGDTWLLRDAGAEPVVDFTDAGLPTTYLCDPATIERTLSTLVGHLAVKGSDAIVIEIADGVFQRETAALLRSSAFAASVDGIVVAARDAMGASAANHMLRDNPVPIVALSGLLSAAPLQCREATAMTGIDVFNREQLSTPAIAQALLQVARNHGTTRGDTRATA